MAQLRSVITSTDDALRNRSLEEFCQNASLSQLLQECADLEAFRHESANLYERVRACLFLYALHRFFIPARPELPVGGHIPFQGYLDLLDRRFEEAINVFLRAQAAQGPGDALSSALANAYHRLAFQTLADQVRRSVRSVRGNQWMFRVGHPGDQPLRVRPELLRFDAGQSGYPILQERTPVRMDLTHSAWSDIFFLGMDFPEGARVLNVSIDLAVLEAQNSQAPRTPQPPVEAYFRIIDEPIVRLVSVDLGASADIDSLDEIFDFARDYLGLLKAALIASGLVPPGIEGAEQSLAELLERLVGAGRGIELISNVNRIPKGSRLAVSTNLLAALIAVCMRATGQAQHLTGALEDKERSLVAARAILGEWLAGSGGGWQDSGGVWPGIKLIEGQLAAPDDPEFGISRGRLLPAHHILGDDEAPALARQRLQESLVLVHGGMAQNVGPILEMVTEKYLLRSPSEWQARGDTRRILDDILEHLQRGDIHAIGEATTGNFFGPLQTIVPWVSNLYTERLIAEVRRQFGADFWGFWMLGGMAGGGMGFMFAPQRKAKAQAALQQIMSTLRQQLDSALPFAMEPVVYDFAINERGTWAQLQSAAQAPLPPDYYALVVPRLMRLDPRQLQSAQRAELEAFARACHERPALREMVPALFDRLLPPISPEGTPGDALHQLLAAHGFDSVQHEQIRHDLQSGRIGLAQNRLPVTTDIEDVKPNDVFDVTNSTIEQLRRRGEEALRAGQVAIVTLAAGVGSRWTQGAGVVKALHPFAKFGGRHRTFLEVHLAKSRLVQQQYSGTLPHIITTSYLTHAAIEEFLSAESNYGYSGPVLLSPGRAIGLRMVPTVRDLRFAWEEMPQQQLDTQAQKVRVSLQAALLNWARRSGEASDYTDNVASQCLHPVGHWYEIPNLLRNGTLAQLLAQQPQLQYLMLHNIDTLGANADPALLGRHIQSEATLTFEVIPRRLEDRGGGLARVDGRVRLVEGLAMPREEQEFALSYYNTLTTWIHIDRLLQVFGLTRAQLNDGAKVTQAIRALASRIPTYVTHKDVKRRWGHGHEDIFPVAQFEKALGRYDGAARHRLPLYGSAAPTRSAIERSIATRRLVTRRFRLLHRVVMRLVVVARPQRPTPFAICNS